MARPKIAADKLRAATIGVRVSSAEYAALREKAAKMGMPPAQWLRSAALARQLPKPSAAPVSVDTYRELGRIGANLNQLVREIHSGAPAPALAEVISRLFELVEKTRLEVLGIRAEGEKEAEG